MMLQQKSALKRTASKRVRTPVIPGSRQADLRSQVDSLLRDIALVLHATDVVRRAMEADQAVCSVAS